MTPTSACCQSPARIEGANYRCTSCEKPCDIYCTGCRHHTGITQDCRAKTMVDGWWKFPEGMCWE